MEHEFDTDRSFAVRMDRKDPLSKYRQRFYFPPDKTYLNGNSLGLLSEEAEERLQNAVDEWKELAIQGWTEGDPPWFFMAETLGDKISEIVGAEPEEVIATGTTTVNIHSLVSTFYEPKKGRDKILADELNFPTDIYALEGQIELKGKDPSEKLKLVPSEDGRTLDEEKIVKMMDDDIALIHLPSVLYNSGQLLDMEYLTHEAHDRDIIIGFDCSHSVGCIPHSFDEIGVDYAVWCSYKYLNGGPGSTAFLYLNKRHFDKKPKLKGWFGYRKDEQFQMNLEFRHQRDAGGWQISSPAILNSAPLLGSIELIKEAGIDKIREKCKSLTSYFVYMVKEKLEGYDFSIGSPREADERSGHIALMHDRAREINTVLDEKGFVTDFRPPGTIRVAFSPLYNSFEEVWDTVEAIKDIMDKELYKDVETGEQLIT